MQTRRRLFPPLMVTLAAAVCLAPYAVGLARDTQASRLPVRLTDREFWRLVVDLSEPSGYFQSDNLVSNERPFQNVVPALKQFPRGGVYLGVAPEQNFTYIVALEPRMAFILDIRRGNLIAHLMYKAILELSPDRADFLSHLFSRRRPAGLSKTSTVHELFAAYSDGDAEPDGALYRENLKAIVDQLTKVRRFEIGNEDLLQLEAIFGMFFQYGPGLTYASSQGRGGRNMPSYADLQVAMDLDGTPRAFLATEDSYGVLRSLEQKNLVVPIVGDFAGPKALRAIGRYVAGQGATVTAYYTSNVEQYLFQNGVWQAFYANVSTLPLDDRSTFIRSARGQNVLDPIQLLLKDVTEGKIQTYASITSRGSVR
ncbi:MAG TPA: hypothetical protein VES67_12365 [Vicinamibacterales bacterium]|nr:hypothetical protein [Vicinamibacterales bacterium]